MDISSSKEMEKCYLFLNLPHNSICYILQKDIQEQYLRSERARVLKPISLRSNLIILKAFLKFIQEAGVTYVEFISYEVAQNYLSSLRLRDCSDGTVTNHRNTLHGIFKCVKRPLGLQENPFADTPAPFRPVRKTHRCFKPNELRKLINSVSPEWRMMILLAFYTGLRFGDCCRFRLEFIEWDENVIKITPSKTTRFKKTLIIPLHASLIEAIKSYTNALSGYLIPEFAERYMKKDTNHGKELGLILRGLGFEKENEEGILDFHSLRHTFNTTLAEGNVEDSIKMKLVGHSSIETNQIYNHAVEPLKQAIKCIPSLKDIQEN